MNSEILKIAIPSIVSNITVPLLGLIDVMIVGHMGNAAYIGAIAIGSMIFNVICWVFGFLRMGTSGMASQAYGRGDDKGVANILVRALLIGLGIGMLFVVMQPIVRWAAMAAMAPQADVLPYACTYFDICICGVPAMLGLYGLNGFFIGVQNTKVPMMVSIFQNVVNIVCSLSFVYLLGMKVEGVALGTLVAQYSGFALSLWLLKRQYGEYVKKCSLEAVKAKDEMKRFFVVNGDIFVRTLFLVAVNFMFTATGAKQGAVVLAVNTLMYQFFTFFSYVMDGFAYAGEAVGGKYYGAGKEAMFRSTVRHLFGWGLLLCLLYTLFYIVCGSGIMHLLSDDASVIAASATFMPWVWLIPFAGMAAFIWDGLYIGITASRGMLISSLVAAVVFFLVYLCLFPSWGNHALWLALLLFLFVRGAVQTLMWRKITRSRGIA